MEEKMPLLSIIVPAYNVENYIEQCVDSILAQSFTDYELLLVDDGSKDSTGRICDEYAGQDGRVRVIHKENGGLVSARKAGLAEAKGEYVAYVDGDDWIAEGMFQKLCECATMQKVDIVITDFYGAHPEKEDKTTQNMRGGRYSKEDLCKEVYPHMLCKGEYFSFGFFPCVWGKVFKRSLLLPNQMKVDDEIKLGEDAACFYPTLLDADSIFYLKEEYLCYYRIRESSITHSMTKSFYTDGILKLIGGMKEQFEKHMDVRDMLHGQLCLYACYMFENMITPYINIKYLFIKKALKREIYKIKNSQIGQEVIEYCKSVRTSSRAKRILRVIEEKSLAARMNLYVFRKYEELRTNDRV